jgi:hypothetical protein
MNHDGFSFSPLLGAFAATITLYEAAVPQPMSTALLFVSEGASITILPIGVGEDGKTTYVEEEVLTEAVAVFSDSTTTIIPQSSAFTCKPLSHILNGLGVRLFIEDTIVEEDASGLFRQASSSNPAVPSQHGQQIIQTGDFPRNDIRFLCRGLNFPGLALTTTYSGS